MSKDFHVTIRVRNGRLLRAMQAAGIKTALELARRTMVGPSEIGAILRFEKPPLLKSGEWSETAWRISSALGLEPEEIWPEHLANLKATKSKVEISMNADELQNIGVQAFPVLARNCSGEDVRKLLGSAKLRPREREVIDRRFGLNGTSGETLEEIAQSWGRSREIVRFHETRAIRELRREARKKLRA